MGIEAITNISSSELNHRERLSKPEKAFLYTLNGGPSATPFCSASEVNRLGIKIIDVVDYIQKEIIENEGARIFKYKDTTIELW